MPSKAYLQDKDIVRDYVSRNPETNVNPFPEFSRQYFLFEKLQKKRNEIDTIKPFVRKLEWVEQYRFERHGTVSAQWWSETGFGIYSIYQVDATYALMAPWMKQVNFDSWDKAQSSAQQDFESRAIGICSMFQTRSQSQPKIQHETRAQAIVRGMEEIVDKIEERRKNSLFPESENLEKKAYEYLKEVLGK